MDNDSAVTRRGLIAGAGALAAATLLARPANAAASSARTNRARTAPSPFLAGAYCAPAGYGKSDWLKGVNVFDGYLGILLGITKSKYYQQEDQISTTIPSMVQEGHSVGCQFLLCAYPLRAGFASSPDPDGSYGDSRTTASKKALGKCLDAWLTANITFECTLRQECNLRDNNGNPWFPSPQAYADYCGFYASEVTSRGIRLAYDPAITDTIVSSAVSYFPPGVGIGSVYTDYYGPSFKKGSRLDGVIGLADGGNPDGMMLPWGLGEWGNSATGVALTQGEWNNYAQYLYNILSTRSKAGKKMGAVMYYSGPNPDGPNILQGPNDYKIPWIKKIAGLGNVNNG